MAKHHKPVGVGLFERKKDSGVTSIAPLQSGTVAPTDKKTEKLRSGTPRGSKERKYHAK